MEEPLAFYSLFKDQGSFKFGVNTSDKYILASKIFTEKLVKSSIPVKVNRKILKRKIKFVDGFITLNSISKKRIIKINDIITCSIEGKLIRLNIKRRIIYIYFKKLTESIIFHVVIDGLLKNRLYYEINDY